MSELYDSKDQKDSRFDSLEEYIWETQRDKDDEVRFTTNLEEWQRQSVQAIAGANGTSDVTVTNRAYNMGIRNVRDVVDEIDGIQRLRKLILDLVSKPPYDDRNFLNVVGELDSLKIEPQDFRDKDDNLSRNSVALRLKDSVVSESRNVYTNTTFMDSSVDRYFIASGLTMSDTLPERIIEYSQDMEDAVGKAVEEARAEVENIAMDSVMVCSHRINKNHMDTIGTISDIKDVSRGECEDACDHILGLV